MTEQDKPGAKSAADGESPEAAPAERKNDDTDAAAAGESRDKAEAGAHANGETADDSRQETTAGAPSGGGGGTLLAWLALLIALAAGGLTGYRWWLERAATDETAGLASAVGELRDDASAHSRRLSDLESRLSSLRQSVQQVEERAAGADRVARLERELQDSRDLLESLPGRMQNLEESMANLQGISAGARDAWLVAEAEYYMQLANAQAQLAGNAELAAYALELADRRIRELGDPVYTPVRRQLAEEIAALRAVEDVDVEGVSLTLASLADVARSLPLDEDVIPEMPSSVGGGDEGELSGVARAWAAVKSAFSDMVSVRRTEEQLEPLLSPDAEYFLRTNIALQLETARLALLKGEPAIFRQSLEDAESWLRRYFDTDTKAVSGALETLGEVRGSKVSAELPDISASLRLFRQQQRVAEGGE